MLKSCFGDILGRNAADMINLLKKFKFRFPCGRFLPQQKKRGFCDFLDLLIVLKEAILLDFAIICSLTDRISIVNEKLTIYEPLNAIAKDSLTRQCKASNDDYKLQFANLAVFVKPKWFQLIFLPDFLKPKVVSRYFFAIWVVFFFCDLVLRSKKSCCLAKIHQKQGFISFM